MTDTVKYLADKRNHEAQEAHRRVKHAGMLLEEAHQRLVAINGNTSPVRCRTLSLAITEIEDAMLRLSTFAVVIAPFDLTGTDPTTMPHFTPDPYEPMTDNEPWHIPEYKHE